MHNFISEKEQFTETTVTLTDDEYFHATRAGRVKVGEVINVTDGFGRRVEARISVIDSKKLTAVILRDISGMGEPPIEIAIALSLIKPSRFEIAVEKCTELGVRRFIPVITERCEYSPQRFNIERMERIAREAVKQSGRSWLPAISHPMTLQELLKGETNRILVTSIQADETIDDIIKRESDTRGFTILIGPEGDFTDNECALLEEYGADFFNLGGLRLRAETAGITATVLVTGGIKRGADGQQ